MKAVLVVVLGFVGIAHGALQSRVVPYGTAIPTNQIVLQNDSYNETGGAVYLQQGFVTGEKAGVWFEVPATVKKLKIDSFRILIGGASLNPQVFFQMGVAPKGTATPSIPADIENAAQLSAGPYWNDVPAEGAPGALRCALPGEMVGAAVEFTHDGVPSVYRDGDGINPLRNTIFAKPGGWNYSKVFGLEGDWVLRVLGHEAGPNECN